MKFFALRLSLIVNIFLGILLMGIDVDHSSILSVLIVAGATFISSLINYYIFCGLSTKDINKVFFIEN